MFKARLGFFEADGGIFCICNVYLFHFKIGSMDKVSHKPGGGDVKIQTQKAKFKAESKIGSLDKIAHKPGGGNVKIENKRLR